MTQEDQRGPSYETGAAALRAGWYHGHRDVSGGWLRPAVFGAVDGLVTNASLISGLGGGGVSAHTVVLTGVAALVAGAFSMGTGMSRAAGCDRRCSARWTGWSPMPR